MLLFSFDVQHDDPELLEVLLGVLLEAMMEEEEVYNYAVYATYDGAEEDYETFVTFDEAREAFERMMREYPGAEVTIFDLFAMDVVHQAIAPEPAA